MNNSNKYEIPSEYQKALTFLKIGCECGCSKQVPPEKFAKRREEFQNLSRKERDAMVMGQILIMDEGDTTTSSRFPKKKRTNNRTFYRWNNKIPLCQLTYLNMLGVSRDYLESVRNHLLNKGLGTRIHGNTGRMPRWNTKMFIDENVEWEVKVFLLSYAEKYGSPDPAGKTKEKITQPLVFLPADMTYTSVYRDFIASRREEIDEVDELKFLKYETFLKLWHELTPHIKFMSPRSDLCDTCHKLRHEIHSCQDETTKVQLKKKNRIHFCRGSKEPTKRLKIPFL